MPAPLYEIRVAEGWATGVLFAPDGALFTTAVEPLVKHWRPESGELLGVFEGHANSADAMALAASGDRLVTGSVDTTARLWDVASHAQVCVLEGHRKTVASVAVSPTAALLATGSYDATVRLWDLESGEAVRVLKGHAKNVVSVAFSPDGSFLASGGIGEEALVWSVPGGELLARFRAHDHAVAAVRFLPDGRLLSAGGDAILRVWAPGAGTWAEVRATPIPAARPFGFALTRDASLVAVTAERALLVVATATGELAARVPFDVKGVYGVAFSDDGAVLATASSDSMVRGWSVPALLAA